MNVRRCAAPVSVVLLLAVIITAQQSAGSNGRHTYSPSGSSFSLQVPGVPLPAQGHIFDPTDNKMAHRLIEHGLRAKTYNFEVNKGDKRSFLVSILEIQTTKRRTDKFLTDSEADAITTVIGDGIERSKVIRQATENGEISQWSYKRKGGLGDDDEVDGMVYVRRWNNCMVIVVVDYDYATAEDAEIKAMLDSLRQR
jgi:hypothetical protein